MNIVILIILLLQAILTDVQVAPAQTAPAVYQQQAVYDRSLDGYYAIGTNVTFYATSLQLFGDPEGTYAGRVDGYMLTSYANQPLSAGYTVDYIVSYTANGMQRQAAVPANQVSG